MATTFAIVLGGLVEQVELRRAQDEAAFLFGHVLLVEGLGAGENGLGKQFAVGGEGRPALDDGAAGFVVDDAGAAGRKHGDAHGRLVEAFGEGHAELLGVFAAHVVMVHGVFEVVDRHVRDEQVVHVDGALVRGDLVAAEDGLASGVVAGVGASHDGEGGGLAVRDGAHLVPVLH